MSSDRLLDESYETLPSVQVDNLEACPQHFQGLHDVFARNASNPIRTLQQKGLQHCGDFTLEATVVYKAFSGKALLTMGCETAPVDAKQAWQRYFDQNYHSSSVKIEDETITGSGQHEQVAVQAYVVSVKDAAAPGAHGLLRPLVLRLQQKRCSAAVFTLPAVRAVVEFKWFKYARKLVFFQLCCYTMWVLLFIWLLVTLKVTTTEHKDNPDGDFDDAMVLSGRRILFSQNAQKLPIMMMNTSQQEYEQHEYQYISPLQGIIQLFILMTMLPFAIMEKGLIRTWGAKRYFKEPANVINLLTLLAQGLILVWHLTGRLTRDCTFGTSLLASQCLLLVFRLMHLTQALRHTPISFLTVAAQVVKDCSGVFIFIALTMVSFGTSFFVILGSDNSRTDEHQTLWRSILAMYEHAYGDLKISDYFNTEQHPGLATALALAYIFLMGFVLINLLLGVIINSLDLILDRQGINQAASQAILIDTLEACVPEWLFTRYKPQWHPAFVHILRIDPIKLDDVDADAMAARKGEFAPEVLEGRQEDADVVEEEEQEEEGGDKGIKDVLEEFVALKKQLKKQEEMLERLCGGAGGVEINGTDVNK